MIDRELREAALTSATKRLCTRKTSCSHLYREVQLVFCRAPCAPSPAPNFQGALVRDGYRDIGPGYRPRSTLILPQVSGFSMPARVDVARRAQRTYLGWK
jgi:hypothetical protein